MNIKSLAKLTTVIAALTFSSNAHALTIGALTFTAETGAVTLDSISGSGTLADPIVLRETVSDLDVTIRIEGMGQVGNPAETGIHTYAFRLVKEIINNTGSAWTFYDNELQETLGVASTEGDGLSFGQGSGQTPVGDLLPAVSEEILLRDYVNFSGGIVLPGEMLTIEYTISDQSANTFFLRQRPNVRETGERVPEAGSTLALGGLALGALSLLRRKSA